MAHLLLSHTNYSFLQGASHARELVEAAASKGWEGLAITDFDGVYGVVQAWSAARARRAEGLAAPKMAYGAEVLFEAGAWKEFPFPSGKASPLEPAGRAPYVGDAACPPVFLQNRVALLAPHKDAYTDLCRLLTHAHRDGKQATPLPFDEPSVPWPRGCVAVLPCRGVQQLFAPADRGPFERWLGLVGKLKEVFGANLHLALTPATNALERNAFANALEASRRLGIPLVATDDVFFHAPERKELHDLLTSVRANVPLARIRWACLPNAERCVHSVAWFERAFSRAPALREALATNARLGERLAFSLEELRYNYPREFIPTGFTPLSYLRHLTEGALHARYHGGAPAKMRELVEKELALIEALGFADYFLTVWDIVRFARERGILCQGRGSSANSAICYLIGVTAVDPMVSDVLFERFVSRERGEPPDIDVDFEHERREEVIQYIYARYGRGRAAMVANVITYQTKGALRAVGKALGRGEADLSRVLSVLSDRMSFKWDYAETLARGMGLPVEGRGTSGGARAEGGGDHEDGEEDGGSGPRDDDDEGDDDEGDDDQGDQGDDDQGDQGAREDGARQGEGRRDGGSAPYGNATGADDDALAATREEIARWSSLARLLKGFPRHLGIHSGGFIVSDQPLVELCPVEPATMEGRSVVQWNKDDVEALGLFKIDILALGMLTAIRKTLQALSAHGRCVPGTRIPVSLPNLPPECPRTYAMLRDAHTYGTFQVESRAQMSMLPRVRPATFYDIVIQVGIVRPGPITSGMASTYVRRKAGLERVTYPDDRLREILERTMGVPIFQEQVMRVAMAVGNFTAGEADELRRSMGAWKFTGDLHKFESKLREGMRANGIPDAFADQIYAHIQGFSQYGFPESHATSFAHIAYASCYLKAWFPNYFLAGLLNSQPMGFYSAHTLVKHARHEGVEALPPCLLESGYDTHVRRDGRVRLGLRLVRSVRAESCARFEALRAEFAAGRGRAPDLAEAGRITAVFTPPERASLALAGAFDAICRDRRAVLWRLLAEGSALREDVEPTLFAATSRGRERWEDTADEYEEMRTSLGPHPLTLIKETQWPFAVPLSRLHDSRSLARAKHGATVTVAGFIVIRQSPPTAKGMTFISLEDERGMVNLVIRPDVYARYRDNVLASALLCAKGKKQENGPQSVVIVTEVFAHLG